MSGYDSWLERPYRDQDAANARFERHIATCKMCCYIFEHNHTEFCDDCGHLWHGDVVCATANGECVGGCDCEANWMLTDEQVADLQNKCADDADQAAYDANIDRQIDERLGK